MGKLKLSQIPYSVVHCGNTCISTLQGPGSMSSGQCLDRTLGKFPPIHGLYLSLCSSVMLEINLGYNSPTPSRRVMVITPLDFRNI